MKNEENKILSVEDILHLQSDKNNQKDKIMPNVDTSKYVLQQKPKVEAARSFATSVNITEEQRKQFNQGNTAAPNRNTILAEQARQAIKIVEQNAQKEAIESKKTVEEKKVKDGKDIKKLADEIRGGKFDFNFGALIEGSKNLKDTI
ncbi:MAG: hypothetical protein FWC03_01925 [Treponema sp.]|nr:hypothetical protein [Treponema sp.]